MNEKFYEAEIERAIFDVASSFFKTSHRKQVREAFNTSDNRSDPDESFDDWLPIQIGTNNSLEPTSAQLTAIREASRRFYVSSEMLRWAIALRRNAVVGNGKLSYSLIPDGMETDPNEIIKQVASDTTATTLLLNWKRFQITNNLPKRIVSWFNKADRDGESIIQLIGGGSEEAPLCRFIDPTLIKDDPTYQGRTRNGIVHSQNDVESEEFITVQNPVTSAFARVDFANLVFTRWNTDYDVSRGVPTGYPVLTNIRRAEHILKNSSRLVALQTAIAMIRKHKAATKPKLSAFARSNATGQRTIDGQSRNVKRKFAGTIIDAPDTIDYEFPSHTIKPEGWIDIIGEELSRVGAVFEIPEHWLLAENVIEPLPEDSPYALALYALQERFYTELEELFWKVQISMGIPEEQVMEYRLQYNLNISGPDVSIPKPLDRARINDLEVKHSVLSPQQWAASRKRNYAVTRAQIIAHRGTKMDDEQFPGDVGNTSTGEVNNSGGGDGVSKSDGSPRSGDGEGKK